MASPIYLDHNATTPIDPRVYETMEPYIKEFFGNPASVEHAHGSAAANAVEKARVQVASSIGARPSEIIFTGSCTEADNIAILGLAQATPDKKHLITTAIEHPAVLEPMRALERQGWRVTVVAVDERGLVKPEDIGSAISNDTALVSVMAANNEVGAMQPIREIGAICEEKGIVFHVDAAQMIGYYPLNVILDRVHLASFSGHKVYGPKGIGALYVRSRRPRVKLEPIMFGGGQERGLRSGTLNTASIVGIGKAFELCAFEAESDGERLKKLCSSFWDKFRSQIPSAQLNGPSDHRLANNLSISVPGVEPLALMRLLRNEISFSSSSACATDKMETSHVLLAMFGETARARQAFRIAPGRFTSEAEMEFALESLTREVRRLQISTHSLA